MKLKEMISYNWNIDWKYGLRSLRWYGLTPKEKGIAIVYELVSLIMLSITTFIVLYLK